MAELRLDGLEVRQGDFALTADFTLPSGQITALVGASGSGKSTLLAVIAGFLPPQTGTVRIGGEDVTERAPGTRPLSILFQDQNLFPHLTVDQNVGLGLRPDLRLDQTQKTKRAEVLARVGLDGFGTRKPGELSGGQQSRAALARALLREQPWLLLDEPFAALGPALRREMLDLVAATAKAENVSVLMVTHDPADALRIADLTVHVADGDCAAPAPTQSLFADPPPALRAYLGQ
jgi:thiamine transport system ATP-binding protein